MSTSDRRARVLLAATAATVVLAAGAPAPAAVPAPPPICTKVLVSPAYRGDRTLVCVHQDVEGVLVLSVSRDAGRSWRRAALAGLLRPAGFAGVSMTVALSPAFAADKSLFATTGSGTFVSKDLAETFSIVDTLTRGFVDGNPVPFIGSPPPLPLAGDGARRLLLAYAGPPTPALIDPAAGSRRPVLGFPGVGASLFVVPPSPTAPAGAIAVVNDAATPVDQANRVRLFRCDAALTCAEPLFAFPPGTWFGPDSQLVAHPDGSLVATFPAFHPQVWRSTDGGATFTAWQSVARLVTAVAPAGAVPPRLAIATTTAAPRRVYLRLEAVMPRTGWTAGSAPASQIFRSDDSGGTWRRVAFARTAGQRGPRGNAPWEFSGYDLQVTPDGRLFASGSRDRLATTWCSLDGGKRWYAGCPR